MKKIFLLITTFTLFSCGQAINTINNSLDINNFKRSDAIRVFTCAINKEDKTAERFALETQLALNKNLSDENWQKLVDLNKQEAFDGVNNVAKKYQCF
jgi:hypothetical protein